MLTEQTLSLSFGQGVDEKTDPKQVPSGKMLTLENAIFQTIKKIRKRNGYQKQGTGIYNPLGPSPFNILGANVTAGRLLTIYKDELILNDAYNLYSYSAEQNNWVYKGRSTMIGLSVQSIVKNISNQTLADSAINTTFGRQLFAWDETNASNALRVGYSMMDSASGQVLINDTLLSTTTSRPRCVSLNGQEILFYFDSSDNKIHAIQFLNGIPIGPIDIITDINTTTPNYDVDVYGGSIYISYYTTAGKIRVCLLNSSLAIIASFLSGVEDATLSLSIFNDPFGNIWVAYAGVAAVKTLVVNPGITLNILPPTIVDNSTTGQNCRNVTGVYSTIVNKGVFFYDQTGLPSIGPIVSQGNNLASTTPVYTQPAVGSTVTIYTYPGQITPDFLNKTIYITGGGFYQITNITPISVFSETIDIKNLGYPGNAAPTTAVPGFPVPGSSSPVLYQVPIQTTSTTYSSIEYNTVPIAGPADSPTFFIKSALLASKAFATDGIPNVMSIHDAQLQPTYFLLSLYNDITIIQPQISLKVAESVAGIPAPLPMLPRINTVSPGVYQLALLQKDLFFTSTDNTSGQSTVNTYSQSGVISVQMDFTLSNPQTKVLGENLHIGAGTLLIYDGANVVEHGFHIYPENVVAVAQAGTTQLAAGTYGYKVTYEWRDNQGQIHRSSPSPSVSVVLTQGEQVQLTIPYLGITNKSNAELVIYRTAANGTVYYRLTPVNNPIPNILNGNTRTYFDAAADNSIIANEQIYTTGEIENIAAPTTELMSTFKNRIILIPSDNPYSFWYSKQVIPGSPVEFSDLFVENVGTTDGPLTGISGMDDKIILFTASSIYYVVGTGPAASGANNDFTDPIFITSDVGCIDGHSIVTTPEGLMFKSAKGIYMLSRSLQASYTGAPVENHNQYDVVSSQLIADSNQVRFILSNGQAVVYDYFVAQWSIFTNISGVSSTIWSGVFVYLAANGGVFKETPGKFSDNGTFITLKAITSWMQFANVQGFQRVRESLILGDYLGPTRLMVQLAYDFNPIPTQQDIIDVQTLLNNSTYGSDPTYGDSLFYGGPSGYPLYQWRIHFAQQKCQAVQMTLQDVPTVPFGEGFDLSALLFYVGVKKGPNKMPASRSFG